MAFLPMIVLDTHALIWDALAPEQLSEPARQAIAQASEDGGIILADISLWEIAMLIDKQRLQVNTSCEAFLTLLLQANDISVQGITPEIAALSVELPPEIGRDPADRLITATAISASLPLVTADRNLRASNLVAAVW